MAFPISFVQAGDKNRYTLCKNWFIPALRSSDLTGIHLIYPALLQI